jgi:hypothetical protein
MNLSDTAVVQVAVVVLFVAAGPGLVSLWLHVRSLAERIDELESLRLLDAAERTRMHQELNELRRGITVLIAQVRRAGMTPEWTPATVTAPTPTAENGQQAETDRLVDLWQRIAERFSAEEIADLAFRLGIPDSHAETDGARARDLVTMAKRRDKLEQLVALCRRERPNGGF